MINYPNYYSLKTEPDGIYLVKGKEFIKIPSQVHADLKTCVKRFGLGVDRRVAYELELKLVRIWLKIKFRRLMSMEELLTGVFVYGCAYPIKGMAAKLTAMHELIDLMLLDEGFDVDTFIYQHKPKQKIKRRTITWNEELHTIILKRERLFERDLDGERSLCGRGSRRAS